VIRRTRRADRCAPAGFALVAICCLIAAGAPAINAAPAAPSSRPAATDVRIFLPLAGNTIASGLTAVPAAQGRCFAASLASQGRSDAWRCSIGNAIMDPCFEPQPPDSGPLACAVSPWSREVRLLKPSAPPSKNEANKGDLLGSAPWALELADGSRCTFLTGATLGVAGMRLNYGCQNKAEVIGDVERSAPVWRVFARRPSEAIVRYVDVLVAWYYCAMVCGPVRGMVYDEPEAGP
jgi:hypothetical protein